MISTPDRAGLSFIHVIGSGPSARNQLREMIGSLEGRPVSWIITGMHASLAIGVICAVGVLISAALAIGFASPWLFSIPIVLTGLAGVSFASCFVPFSLSSVRLIIAVNHLKKGIFDSKGSKDKSDFLALVTLFSPKNAQQTEELINRLSVHCKTLSLFTHRPNQLDPLARTHSTYQVFLPLAIDSCYQYVKFQRHYSYPPEMIAKHSLTFYKRCRDHLPSTLLQQMQELSYFYLSHKQSNSINTSFSPQVIAESLPSFLPLLNEGDVDILLAFSTLAQQREGYILENTEVIRLDAAFKNLTDEQLAALAERLKSNPIENFEQLITTITQVKYDCLPS